MTLETECATYIRELVTQSPVISTSHRTLHRIRRKYGQKQTDTEIDRQFSTAYVPK